MDVVCILQRNCVLVTAPWLQWQLRKHRKKISLSYKPTQFIHPIWKSVLLLLLLKLITSPLSTAQLSFHVLLCLLHFANSHFFFVPFPFSYLWCQELVNYICFFPKKHISTILFTAEVCRDKILKGLNFCIRLSVHPLLLTERNHGRCMTPVCMGKTEVDCNILWLNPSSVRMSGCLWRQKMV